MFSFKKKNELIRFGEETTFTPIDTDEIKTRKDAVKFNKLRRKQMIKDMKQLKALAPQKLTINSSTDSIMPYIDTFEGGIFQMDNETFTVMYEISNMNYSISRIDVQENIFVKYCELLNYFPSDTRFQIFLNNQKADLDKMKKRMFMQTGVNDGLDEYREEYNQIIMKLVEKSRNDIDRGIYIVVSVKSENAYEAMETFNSMDFDMSNMAKSIGTSSRRIDTTERLELLHNSYRYENVGDFNRDNSFDYIKIKNNRINTKKYIAPMSVQVKPKYLKVENRYVRNLFITNESLKNEMHDDFITSFTSLDIEMQLSMYVEPVSSDSANKLMKAKILGMESNLLEKQKRLIKSVGDATFVNQRLVDELEEARQLRKDIEKGQKMFFVTYTISVYGNSRDEVDKNTELIKSTARKRNVEVKDLEFQQLDAFTQTLPYCVQKLKGIDRTLTTESLAVFLPFRTVSIVDDNGVYCGMNKYSKELIFADRNSNPNSNGWITGATGFGKSFSAKREMFTRLLKEDDIDIMVIDPDAEYGRFAKAFGGEVVKLSNEENSYINPFEMVKGDSMENKIDLLLSIVEQMKGSNQEIDGQERSVLTRCINHIYAKYVQTGNSEDLPILADLYNEIKNQPEDVAQNLAVSMESYLDSLFSHRTNIDFENRFIVFDISKLGTHVQTAGLLVTLDACWNRILRNMVIGRKTYFFIDEIYLLFANEYSSEYLYKLWKRCRKYNAVATGITQNIEDLVHSERARTMLGNSEYLCILKQSYSDVKELQKILSLSDAEVTYLQQADTGEGLLKVGKNIVPFMDDFPKDTKLYKLITTKPEEVYSA